MNTVDWIVLAVLGLGLVRGFSTGAIQQVASLVGVLLAFILAAQFMQPVGDLVTRSLGISSSIAPLVGFVSIFAIIQLLVFGVSRLLEAFLKAINLSIINRFLGGLVGAFKALLLMSVALYVLGYVGIPDESTRRSSRLYDTVYAVLPGTWDYVSDHLPHVDKLARGLRERAAPAEDLLKGRQNDGDASSES